jgi:hypothetical protein
MEVSSIYNNGQECRLNTQVLPKDKILTTEYKGFVKNKVLILK